MWIDEEGRRLFEDSEVQQLGSIDLTFYGKLQDECQQFAHDKSEASQLLGKSVSIPASALPVESVSN
jgi:hypothetical protein